MTALSFGDRPSALIARALRVPPAAKPWIGGALVRQLGVRGAAALPVVDPASGRLAGLLTRAHVLAAYERAASGGAVASSHAVTAAPSPPSAEPAVAHQA